MLSRVRSILPVALVLLASGQSAFAAVFTYDATSESFSSADSACLSYANLIGSKIEYFLRARVVSTSPTTNPQLRPFGYYECHYQFSHMQKDKDGKEVEVWDVDSSLGFVKEVLNCRAGDLKVIRGPTASAIFSDKEKRYFVASRAPEGCFSGCSYEPKSNNTNGCYLVSGSTTQGYCNYSLENTGKECAANTLTEADWSGDSLIPDDDDDECEGTDCDVPPPEPGTGEPGTGTGEPGTGEPGTGAGEPGTGQPGTGTGQPGTGQPGTGTGEPGTGEPETPCKGDDFGSESCPEYKQAQSLNATNADITQGVEQVQKGVDEAVNKTQSEADKLLDDSERSVLQRFNSFLPAPSACVNPVVNFYSWLSIPIEICRFTFVKTLLTWLFSVATFIYVFRVMTSLGSSAEA